MKGNISIVALLLGALALIGVAAKPVQNILFDSGGEEIPTSISSGDQPFTVGSTLTVSGTGTSTFSGGLDILTVGGIETQSGLVVTGGDLLLTGLLKSNNTATTAFAGGVSISTLGGLSSVSGLTITGGSILATNIGAVFGSTTVAGLSSANGVTLTGGCFKDPSGNCVSGTVSGSGADGRVAFWNGASSLSSNTNFLWGEAATRLTVPLASTTQSLSIGNLLDVDGTGTSTFDGAVSTLRITGTQATSSAQFGTSTPSAISSVEVRGDIFIGNGQSYSEWVPLNMGAMQNYIDCSLGNRFTGTLADAVTVVRVKNCKSGQTAILRLINNAANLRIGWSSSSPVIVNCQYASTTANAVQWFGGVMHGNFFTILAATTSNQTCGIGC